MVADLYQAMQKKERGYLSIVDGIIAGEGQGPFCPTSKNANTIIVGNDLLYTDLAAVRYMGINPEKIKYLSYFINQQSMDLDKSIEIVLNGENIQSFFSSEGGYKNFYVVDRWREIKLVSYNEK